VVLSAGGTGGHLFPAQALAGELARRGRPVVVMTDARFANYATEFPGALIETVPSSPLGALAAVAKIPAGIILAFAKLLRLKPAAVIGFGGYPSVPVLLAAILARIPTAIIEQNTVVGRANRLVMDRVRLVAAAFPLARYAPRRADKVVLTGNPLRPQVQQFWGASYPAMGDALHLLVFGGSQGARFFSEIVPAALIALPRDLKQRLRIVQQCRPEDLEAVRALYDGAGIKAELQPFFSDLPARMAAAHLVIARSGAGTIAELAAIGRPAILVPLPHAMDDHQTYNARLFAAGGAGWLAPQAALTAERLTAMLGEIIADPDGLAARAAAAHRLATPQAARKLADLVEGLMLERSVA
jgi:UDP-N-acetylglucosamine--N-acetylmuramyl-(pentapeptide) pyrophosphoryl-undecaprenol N-acetylglucosamine transferase